MTLEEFDKLVKKGEKNGIIIASRYNIFTDYELFDFDTLKGKKYDSLEELVNDNRKLKEIIESSESDTIFKSA